MKNKGITLIALVITIIVLLILAGISIAMLTGENGILTKADNAQIETRGASVEEARNLWRINKEADKHTENGTAQTLEELINDLVNQNLLTEDEKDQILGNESKGIEAKYEITIGSRTIEFINMINFSIDEDEYRVLEGTTWQEFFSENFPNEWEGWMYYTINNQVCHFKEQTGDRVEFYMLQNEEKEIIEKDLIIESRKLLL